MKNIILLFFIIFTSVLYSQDFDKKWDKVIQFENDGKIRFANEEVQKIYKKAKSSNNEVQIIKCFFYKSKYIQTLEESAQSKIISNLENEINSVSIPSKAILNLVYAKCLTQYSNDQKNRIYSRTKIDSLNLGSFLTWTHNDFEHKINELYEESLENETTLKNTTLKKYEPIFDFLNLAQFSKLNLYDYIIDENIQFYSSKISEWESSSITYSKFKENLFSLKNDFSNLNLDFILNQKLKHILSLYQNKEKNNPSFENKLARIKFCNQFMLNSNEDYISTIENFQKINSDSLFSQKLLLEKGILYSKNASKEKHSDYNVKALTCFDSIINFKNHSNPYKIASSLKQTLMSKSLSIELQKYIYNNEHTRAFIYYKNVDDINISFFKINFKILNLIEEKKISKDSLINDIISKNKPYKNISQKLLNKKDYFDYTTEILLPELETGNYLAYFESENYNDTTKAYDSEVITVSNISVLANKSNTSENYTVLDRKTGKPLENVVLKSSYFETKTDKNGNATIKIPKDNKSNWDNITLTTLKDTLKINKGYINNIEDENGKKFIGKVAFYLDRAIYRPGQTMYYKGILTQIKDNKSGIVPNVTLKINIENEDGDSLKEFEVTTNEYGSFYGEFVLPKNGLTGQYKISADEPKDYTKDATYDKIKDEHPFWDNVDFDNSEMTFKVEEYKKPKFDVAFEPLKGNHQLNEKIEIVGNAKSFAGSSISDAKVSYTIATEIPYNLRKNSSSENEITIGETKTDVSGKFTINFEAKPVENSTKEVLPIYNYVIKADVTDSNGETHSSETRVRLGYHSLLLNLFVPRIVENKKKNTIQINSTNLNWQFMGTEGELKFYFIKNFGSKFKPRTFQKPEIETISNEDFNTLFPYENNENQTLNNETGTLVYTLKVNTNIEKEIALDFMSNFKPGNYKVIFSALDKYNNLIEKTSDFQFKKEGISSNKIISFEQLNDDAKKDKFIKLKIISIVPELHLISTGSYQNNTFWESNIELKNHEAIIEIPIQPNNEGTIKIVFETILENQYFKEEFETFIKEVKSKILFETESFRDKIQPGSIENWSFKLKENNSIVQTEVLASMYDSSLDEFATKNWESLSFRQNNYNYTRTNTNLGFQNCSATIKNLNNSYYYINDLKNEQTKLIWFGFDFNNNEYSQNIKEYKNQITKKAKKPLDAKLITGFITDSKLPIPGINIQIKGTNRTCTTDFDGYFEIEASIGEIIVVDCIGYKTLNQTITSKKINIELKSESMSLQEVVVTAQGIKREKKSLGYATQILSNGKVYEGDYDSSELIQTLQGRAVGVNITNDGSPGSSTIIIRGSNSLNGTNEPLYVLDGEIISSEEFKKLNTSDILNVNLLKGSSATALYGSKAVNGAIIISTKKALQELNQVQSRKNLNETAFFYPNLKTDKDGKVIINFTSPEALTQWKLRLFAHNKNAVSGYLEKNVITQKDLMVIPNFPRFFREKDTIVITSKIANMTKETKKGMAILQLFDASTMESIDSKTGNQNNIKNFTINASGNTTVSWKIAIPEGLQGIQYKVVAKSGNYSDGEENILPVLTNNMLVTESIPIWVKENSKKIYSFENLKNSSSTTLRNHQFTLEYTSNPTWIAIQSLPYLMEYEHECAEQTFARFYANALATEIINSNPKIVKLFKDWKSKGKLTSKLEQNEELKSMILAETPWLKDAESEEEKKNKLAVLFDLEKMKNTQDATFEKLKNKQNPSGGFVWFDGGTENEFITRHILSGFGHLKNLKINTASDEKINEVIKKGVSFIDSKFLESHKQLIDYQKKYSEFNWGNPYSNLHYLYTRSFYLEDYPLSDTLKSATKKYVDATKENWLNFSLYEKGLAALTLYRFGEKATAKKIIESLKETSSNNEDWGMYWIENKSGWYWYQAPIETQALLIEAFSEIGNDTKSIDAMKVWLLKNKQTKNWPTTKSTTEAIYALLIQGTDWLSVKDNTVIKIGDEKIMTKKLSENEKEAETGYIKTTWKADEIKPEMASISIENKSKVPGYGGVYWQYFENLDKIKNNISGNLSTSKELYLKKTTNKGEELQKINSNNPLKIGDLVTVRLIIVAKEDMEYVHLKDMRASCFEPINVLSEYQWKDGLGFYMNTKDAATHFFFEKINKGTYVLEYDLRVNNMGNFSNGITTIESMYAPEFTNHTKGIRVNVKE